MPSQDQNCNLKKLLKLEKDILYYKYLDCIPHNHLHQKKKIGNTKIKVHTK